MDDQKTTGGLPEDTGNSMSERSVQGESGTGETDTPVASGHTAGRREAEDQPDAGASGTTFDAGSSIPGR
ncbi:hypothetical protein LAJ19_04000 [Deinococcus taeanensis]|uniref:hypothetical protein n=1 Tax=Deinococcus taeanensis TaxID=2737050 RepID=UPI001CDBF0B7|nr:hypothetical protein [Deinococcus taeanensis]UBV43384.1 hypothetical protein LAJ19_04000 [Deinococcus taeanensis]